MGYQKEIVVTKNSNCTNCSVLKLLDKLDASLWTPTLSLIELGSDSNWVTLDKNLDGEREFIKIIAVKEQLKEYIGFTIRSEENKRHVHVNIDHDRIIFDIEIDKDENELKWFNWYHKNLVVPILNEFDASLKVEWRSNYDNRILKLFKE